MPPVAGQPERASTVAAPRTAWRPRSPRHGRRASRPARPTADGAEQATSSGTPAAAIGRRLKLPSLRMLEFIAALFDRPLIRPLQSLQPALEPHVAFPLREGQNTADPSSKGNLDPVFQLWWW